MKKVELLAPAGNLENFYIAINNGADAVYLGIDEFNARGNIENFNLENIKSVIDYAHLFGVKVYITLNILISDCEMSQVLDIAGQLLKFGADAFIIQDLGLAYAIKNIYPNAVLHASTQMGICNLEGAKFVQKLGFSRVVLARETKLEEIRRIYKNCDIEIEFFVQGALCVSYSGNCYFSALEAGASGNRGKCKQFCRLPYSIESGEKSKQGYLLSAKDFCLIDQIKDLVEAGVVSLKIEGRARRAGYVGQVVSVYRDVIDKIEKQNISINEMAQYKDRLKLAFNRGDYISGYFKNEKIIDSDIQGHRGILIGKVLSVKNGKRFNVITIKCEHKLTRGDGLKFILNNKEVGSVGVGDIKTISKNVYELTTTANIQNLSNVYLTLDFKNEENLAKKQRKLKIKADFTAKIDDFAVLKLKYNDILIQQKSENKLQKALNQPLTKEEIITQISKGNETFEIEFEEINLEKVFIRKAELNELRRQAFEKLKEKIIEIYYNKNLKPFVKNLVNLKTFNEEKDKQKIVIFDDFEKLKKENLKNCKLVYQPKEFNRAEIQKIISNFDDEIYLSLPIYANEADIKLFKLIFEDNKHLGIYANNYYALNLIEGRKVIVSNNLNVYNSYSILALKEESVEDIIVSVESEEKLFNSEVNLYQLSNYKPVLMNFLHCPFKEHFGSECKNCTYKRGATLKMQNGKKFDLERTKAVTCSFSLISKNIQNSKQNSYFDAFYL